MGDFKAQSGDRLGDNLPDCDTNDPGSLEAWYAPYGFCESYRKVVLSNCREIVRASAALAGQKISEARIDDLARTHANYLDFLAVHLQGRRLREKMIRGAMGL